MRHFYLTASILTALTFSACTEARQNDADITSSAEAVTKTSNPTPQETSNTKTPDSQSFKMSSDADGLPTLPEGYQGLDLTEISRAEIDELIALENPEKQHRGAYQEEVKKWREQPSSTRGPLPQMEPMIRNQEDSERLEILYAKLRSAEIRKRYENLDSNILTKTEIEEIIALERDQLKITSEYQRKYMTWSQEDPATRGPQPESKDLYGLAMNPRLQELQGKIQNANQMKRLAERVEKLSATYNVSLSDSEISELTDLQAEEQKIQTELSLAMMKLTEEGQINEDELSEETILNVFPKHALQRMLDVDQRMKAIKAPIEAAEKADRIRKQMTKLSQDSGVSILSGEIAETIELNAEKRRIKDETESEAIRKWLYENGPMMTGQPLPSDENYARLKEIDARLKAISAPMNDAKNAALEAENPALRKQRLETERQQKWRDDWQDKKQSGEVPADARLNSPSYAELKDRVKNYRKKLETRAEKAGYDIPKDVLTRLDALNDDMLAIRKKVHKMEADGTATIGKGFGYKRPAFGVTAGMYKVRLIETKQLKILAGLTASETPFTEPNEIGRRASDHDPFGMASGLFGAEAMIQNFRDSGMEISQSEADDLIAFEQALKEK